MKKTIVTVLALTVGACAPISNGEEQLVSVTDRYPITVNEDMATLSIDPSGRNGALSDYDRAQIATFVAEYKARGAGPMTLSEAASPPASRAANEVRGALSDLGIGSDNVLNAGMAPSAGAPVVLSFQRYVASALECGVWDHNLGYTQRNLPWSNFGCATQNNLAAMVVNPRDLVQPRDSDPSDAERRAVVIEKYRKGEPTGASRSSEDKGTVSTAVEE